MTWGRGTGVKACACDMPCLVGCSMRIAFVCRNGLGPNGYYAGGPVPRDLEGPVMRVLAS